MELCLIGADALPPDRDFPAYRFPASVELKQQTAQAGSSELNLQSGMSITANIRVRSRPVISLVTDLFTVKLRVLTFR